MCVPLLQSLSALRLSLIDRESDPAIGSGLFFRCERDKRGKEHDLGFLFNLGMGLQYDWTERLAFGTRMTFNVMPSEVLNGRFFFSWQLAQLRYRF